MSAEFIPRMRDKWGLWQLALFLALRGGGRRPRAIPASLGLLRAAYKGLGANRSLFRAYDVWFVEILGKEYFVLLLARPDRGDGSIWIIEKPWAACRHFTVRIRRRFLDKVVERIDVLIGYEPSFQEMIAGMASECFQFQHARRVRNFIRRNGPVSALRSLQDLSRRADECADHGFGWKLQIGCLRALGMIFCEFPTDARHFEIGTTVFRAGLLADAVLTPCEARNRREDRLVEAAETAERWVYSVSVLRGLGRA